jgi:hypothetical protein
MALVRGQHVVHAQGGAVTASLTNALNAYAKDDWPPHAIAMVRATASRVASHLPVLAPQRAVAGAAVRHYVRDYYNRIHLQPKALALGNVVTAQQRSVSVWNAWIDRSAQIDRIVLNQLDSIVLGGQGNPPLMMTPLQMLSWDVSIGITGSATLNGSIDWHFAEGEVASLAVTGNRVTAWTFVPNWQGGITERLAWLTLVERGSNGVETSTPLRETPRRSWEFQALAEGTTRQRLEAMLVDGSARNWAVPVFTDQSVLATPVTQGSTTIPVNTAALDFTAGGLAILHQSALRFEVVQVDTVAANAITLKIGAQATWPAGTRLFPMRMARLDDWPQLDRYSSAVLGASSVRFVSVDANDWPAQMPATTYRGLPVLETRPEWSDNPSVHYGRDVTLIDNDIGMVFVDDVTGLPWPTQTHRWQLVGRTERDTFRRLLYALQGRANTLWVPTWSDDLTPMGPLNTGDYALQVAWHGYTAYLHQQPGRRDIRIELADGTVLYRRITGSVALSADIEQLSVDTAWVTTVLPKNIVRMSFMGLCRLNADAVEIQHVTDVDGVAACAVTFAQVTANG